MTVRDEIPVRRTKLTQSEKGKNYSKHKPDLKKDFNNHCGYCGAYDGFGYTLTYFEIDHFIPKDFLIKNNSKIGLCKYSNLVYSCRFCNNNKTKFWPSEKDDVFRIKNVGYIDPCDPDYEKQFYRNDDGAILWRTQLGKWMSTVAFKFDIRIDEIKLLWKYNQTRKNIEKIAEILNQTPEGSDEFIEIKKKLSYFHEKHYQFQKILSEFYK